MTVQGLPAQGRSVSAVVLLGELHRADSLDATIVALAHQSEPADRVVVAAAARLDQEVENLLTEAFDAGRIDEVLRIPDAPGSSRQGAFLSGAVREVLRLLSAPADAPESELPEQPELQGAPDLPDDPERSEAADPLAPPRARGGHERVIDPEVALKEMRREAGSLAQVPVRLREGESAVGSRARGRRRARVGADSWLWLLTADAVPGHESLEQLLRELDGSPTTAVVGSKRLTPRPDDEGPLFAEDDPWIEPAAGADEADQLLDVGLTLTHTGRVITGIDPGEVDQGQADWREDALAVALPGMLVREHTLVQVGGFDPALPTPWAEIDLCQRVWRSGERVAVAGLSRVLADTPERPEAEATKEFRRGQILARLKSASLPIALLTLVVLVPLETLGRVVARIVGHRPALALAEISGVLSALPSIPAVMGRGMRTSRHSPVPRRRLAPLYLPVGENLRQRGAALWTRVFADDERSRRIRRTTWGISGTSHGADDADFGRHGVWTLMLLALSAIVGLLAVRPLLTRGRLEGPLLLPLSPDWEEARQSAWASWIPAGLGERGPADALVRLAGLAPLPGEGLVSLLLILAIPLSALGAWWAAGAITRAVGARLALAVVWGAAPPLLAALIAGAWPLVLVHVLLPLLALAVGRAIGLVHKVSQASVSAAAAAGLLLLVIGAVQPVLVLLVGAALGALAPLVPGRRLRLLWAVIPSLALHLPLLPVYVAHPSALLHAAGVPASAAQPSALELLALWPAPAPQWNGLGPVLGSGAAQLAPLLLLVPVLAAALLAPFLYGDAGRAGRYGLLVAAGAIALVLLARTVPTALTEDARVSVPVHALLSCVLIALMIAAAAAYDALARFAQQSRRRRILAAVSGALVAAVSVSTVIGWALVLPSALQVHRTEAVVVPQAARDESVSPARTRVLLLTETEADAAAGTETDGEVLSPSAGRVDAQLLVDGGPVISQLSGVAEARDLDQVLAGAAVDADPGSEALRAASSQLLSAGAPAAPTQLRTLAIGYVVVPGAAEDSQALVDALDSSPQLEKVTQNASGGLWRVVDAGSRATVRPLGVAPDPATDVAVPAGVVTASGEIAAAPEERVVVLSERRDSAWRARIDGTELAPVTVDGWAQGWALPAGAAGQLEIDRPSLIALPAQLLLLVVVVVTALVAIPWRSSGPRRRRDETWFGGVL